MKIEIAPESRGSDLFEETRSRYVNILEPLFFPKDPTSHDIVRYFASLLRVVGLEDRGWDPYLESRLVVEDLHALAKIDLPYEKFEDVEKTRWRLALLFYQHVIEMNATYEVIANLLRFRLNEGYSPNPFFKFLNAKEKRKFKAGSLFPKQKIAVIERLDDQAKLGIGALFSEFVRHDLRNSISHSDFIITDGSFRSRNGYGMRSFKIELIELDRILTASKAFISAFFILEKEARRVWGITGGRALPYDPVYKGLLEVLTDRDGLMNGFRVHWPNQSESTYRRTDDGIDMTNCNLDFQRETIEFFVGMYARNRDQFSPLVELGCAPVYTPIDGTDEIPKWDDKAAAAPSGPQFRND